MNTLAKIIIKMSLIFALNSCEGSQPIVEPKKPDTSTVSKAAAAKDQQSAGSSVQVRDKKLEQETELSNKGIEYKPLSVDVTLSPVAIISINDGVEEQFCVGSLVKDRLIATAAHCFETLKSQKCSDSVTFSWLKIDLGKVTKIETSGIKCLSIKTISAFSDGEKGDLAFVSLAEQGTFPAAKISFAPPATENQISFAAVVPMLSGIEISDGATLGNDINYMRHNSAHIPGMSGGPLLKINQKGDRELNWEKAVGIHVGGSGPTGKAILAKTILPYLNEQN